jgi:hypothetical protein
LLAALPLATGCELLYPLNDRFTTDGSGVDAGISDADNTDAGTSRGPDTGGPDAGAPDSAAFCATLAPKPLLCDDFDSDPLAMRWSKSIPAPPSIPPSQRHRRVRSCHA